MPTLTSSTGGAESETRIVSPIPSASNTANAVADFMVPWKSGPPLLLLGEVDNHTLQQEGGMP